MVPVAARPVAARPLGGGGAGAARGSWEAGRSLALPAAAAPRGNDLGWRWDTTRAGTAAVMVLRDVNWSPSGEHSSPEGDKDLLGCRC